MSLPALLGAARLKDHPELGLAAFGVLIALADHHNGSTGRCFPSQATLAARARVTVRSAQRALAELVSAQLIEILPGEGSGHGARATDAYKLKFPFVYPPDATLRPANGDSASENDDRESYQEGKKKEEEQTHAREGDYSDLAPVDVPALIEVIWAGVGDMGRKRSTKGKLEKAVVAALRRRAKGVSPEDHLKRMLLGLRGYLESRDAKKENGAFEHGAHRTFIDDAWASFVDDGASSAAPVDPEVGTALEPGPKLQRYWMETHQQGLPWGSDRGPRPGAPGCRVSDALQVEFGVTPWAPPVEDDDAGAFD